MDNEAFLGGLREQRLLAIIRGTGLKATVATAEVLLEEGFRYVEVALTTPGALHAIEAICASAGPDCVIGGGTVMTEGDVKDVISAGAKFAVTPAVVESISHCARRNLPVLAGAFTASEAVTAMGMGAAGIKLFPVSSVGPGYVRALREPLPQIPFLAVGGVDASAAPDYLAAGAIALGVGGPLIGDAAAGGDLDELRLRARNFLQLVREPAPEPGA